MHTEKTPNEPLRSGRLFGHLSRLPAKPRCDFCGPRTGNRPTARVRINLGCCDLCAECRDGLLTPILAEMPLPNTQGQPRQVGALAVAPCWARSAEYAEALNDIADELDLPTGVAPADIVLAVRNRLALGIHTCHAECQRPLCVAHREIDRLNKAWDSDRAIFRGALEDIVRGDYADGAERAHPAVSRAKRALGLLQNK